MAEPTRCVTPMARLVSPGPLAIATYPRSFAPALWLPLPGSPPHPAPGMAGLPLPGLLAFTLTLAGRAWQRLASSA